MNRLLYIEEFIEIFVHEMERICFVRCRTVGVFDGF